MVLRVVIMGRESLDGVDVKGNAALVTIGEGSKGERPSVCPGSGWE